METLITIFREVHDPRCLYARHDLATMLFIALAACLYGAKSSVEIADFAEANEAELADIVDLPHGAPSHDSFSRLFRLLDPEELAQAFARFTAALREGLGLGPAAACPCEGRGRGGDRQAAPAKTGKAAAAWLRTRPRLHASVAAQRVGRRDPSVDSPPTVHRRARTPATRSRPRWRR